MKEWLTNLAWQLLSFKFVTFWTAILLTVVSWLSLEHLFDKSIQTADTLFAKGYITKEAVTAIITHSQTILYDQALSHLLIFYAALFASIFAVRGVSYYTESKTTQAVVEKISTKGNSTEDLKQFLPKGDRT